MLSLKRKAVLYLKNALGSRTNRKVVVFSVDDYGNVRQNSKQSRAALENKGLKISNRFDALDGLETADDLYALFETLSRFKDVKGNSPIFTVFTNPQNMDFEKIKESGYKKVFYKDLNHFHVEHGQKDAWETWQEGISMGLLCPQYHGRSHFHEGMLQESLDKKDKDVIACIDHHSYCALNKTSNGRQSYVSTYSYNSKSEFPDLIENAKSGVNAFERVFGCRPDHFTAPGQLTHSDIEKTLEPLGVSFIDSLTLKKQYEGANKYSQQVNYTGKSNYAGQRYIVRNCVFEPLIGHGAKACLEEISIAFQMSKPANISSHRVNFCGRIEESNRKKGLPELQFLIQDILKRWPDVEFINTTEIFNESEHQV